MDTRFTNWIGKKGADISLRMIVFIVVFTIILVILAFLLKKFYPNANIVDRAYAVGANIF